MIENLPNELIYYISCYLDRKDVISLMCTSKDLKDKLYYRINYFNNYRNLRNKYLHKWCKNVIDDLFDINLESINNIEFRYYFDIMIHYTQFIQLPNEEKFVKNIFYSIFYHQYLQLYFLNFYPKTKYITSLTNKILKQISINQTLIENDLSYFDLIDVEIYLYLFNEYKIEFPFIILHKFFELSLFSNYPFIQDNIMFEFACCIVSKDIKFFESAQYNIIQKLIYLNTNQIYFDCFCIYVDRFISEESFEIYEFYFTSLKFLINNNYIFDLNNYYKKGFYYYCSVFYSLFCLLIKICKEYEIDNIISFKNYLTNLNDIPTHNINTMKFYKYKFQVIDYIMKYDFDSDYSLFQDNFKNFIIDILIN
jgi:hypothetical protein